MSPEARKELLDRGFTCRTLRPHRDAPERGRDAAVLRRARTCAVIVYVCNPNNPTGTLTPREDIEYLLAKKPVGSVVLLDEAYIHISKNAAPCLDLVVAGKDLIVLRTFSKIYGMAGLRAGAAFARPDLLRKLLFYGVGPLPSTGMAGATASLKSKNLVKERREAITAVRDDVFSWLTTHNYSYVPSESNKFMLDVKRPGHEIVRALAAENVYIGRVWPAWPTHVRVSVGTREEMQNFKTALQKAMA